MSFLDTLVQMLVILFAVALGYVAHRLGYLGPEINRKLSKLIIHITLPALALSAVINSQADVSLEALGSILVAVLAFYGVSLALAFLVPPLLGGSRAHRGVWQFSLVFSNAAFIGYPVIEGLFGEKGLFYAVLMVLPMTLMNFTLAPVMLGGTASITWHKLVTPGTVCSLLALVLAFTGWRPPEMVGEMLDMVGDITIPLSLLALGSMLASMPAKSVLSAPRLWVLSLVRLVVMPGVLALLLRPFGIDPLLLSVAVVEIGMPVAVNGSMMCLEFGGDADVMAQGIFLSTVLCIVTIPLVTALFL